MNRWLGSFSVTFITNELTARLLLLIAGILTNSLVHPYKRRIQAKDWPDFAYPFADKETFPTVLAGVILFGECDRDGHIIWECHRSGSRCCIWRRDAVAVVPWPMEETDDSR